MNTRCLAINNNNYWHPGIECEHPQLKLNVSQLTITKHLLIITGLNLIRNTSNFSLLAGGVTSPYLKPDWFRWDSLLQDSGYYDIMWMVAKDTIHALISNKPKPYEFKQIENNIFL